MKTPSSSNKFMIFLLIYLFLLPYILVFASMMLIPHNIISKYYSYYNLALNALLSFFGFAAPIILYCKRKKEPIANFIPHNKLSFKSIIILIAISIFIEPITSFLSTFSSIFVDNNVNALLTDSNTLPYWFKLLCLAIIPALFEELMFRGFLLSGYKKAKVWQIALASGLFFGAMHMDVNQFSYAFPIGAYFAVLVYYSGSIYSSMLLHFIINFTSVTLSHIASFFYSSADLAYMPSIEENIYYLKEQFIFTLISVVILFFLTKYFISLNKDNAISNKASHKEDLYTFNAYSYSDYFFNYEPPAETQSPNSEKIFTPSFFIVIALFILFIFIR